MEEYISKVDAVDVVEYANGNMTWAERDDCKKRLEELPPADVVQVVRCKDCKYNSSPPECGNAVCDTFYGMTDQMGFCHMGEKREE